MAVIGLWLVSWVVFLQNMAAGSSVKSKNLDLDTFPSIILYLKADDKSDSAAK